MNPPSWLFTRGRIRYGLLLASLLALAAPRDAAANPAFAEHSVFGDDWEILNNDIFFGGANAIFGLSPASRTLLFFAAPAETTKSAQSAFVEAEDTNSMLSSFATAPGSLFRSPSYEPVNSSGAGLIPASAATDLYWRTNGTLGAWPFANWGTTAAGPFTNAWISGADAFFTANSQVEYGTSPAFGDVTLSDGINVAVFPLEPVPAGTHEFTIGAGSTLNWSNQRFNTATTLIKSGPGTLILGTMTVPYTGGFTLNGGTIDVNGNLSLGSGSLTINGGTILSTSPAPLNFTPTSIVLGGDFALAGLGHATWGAPVALGSSTRTITNQTDPFSTATRTFSGTISGSGGLTFNGTGGSGGIVLSGANTYSGATTINGGIVTAAGPNAMGGTSNITVNSGTLLFSNSATTNRINDNATMTLNGGTLNTAGLSERGVDFNDAGIGALTLQSNSIIDLGNGSSVLAFANSSLAAWTPGAILSIYNWSGNFVTGEGTDRLAFGNNVLGLTPAQLSQIRFYSDAGTTFLGIGGWASDLDGEVVPVPEPATWLGAALTLGAIGLTQRRRLRALLAPRV